MKKTIKFLIKIFLLKQFYFGLKMLIRGIVELHDGIHTIASKFAFYLSNLFNWKLSSIPFFIAKELKNSDIVVDCGANVGKIVKPLLKYRPTIYCFEPNPVAFGQLKKNLGFSDNLHLVNKAVGVENKTARLFKHISSVDSEEKELIHSVSASLLSSKPNVDTQNFYEIEIIDFLDFLRKINVEVFIVKIDIEGSEIELVNALLDVDLHKKIKYLFVETHENTIPELLNSTILLKDRVKNLNLKNIYFNWT